MRQETELFRVRVLAQGLMDVGGGVEKDMKATADVYRQFVEAIMPYTVKQRVDTDKRMTDMMKKEAAKGMILFKPTFANPLQDRAKQMQLPDEFRRKLAEARKKRDK